MDLVVAVVGVAAFYGGVLRPIGIWHARKRLQKTPRNVRISQMECELGLCDHMVDGMHPREVWSQYGTFHYQLPDGRIWKVGEDPPEKV